MFQYKPNDTDQQPSLMSALWHKLCDSSACLFVFDLGENLFN